MKQVKTSVPPRNQYIQIQKTSFISHKQYNNHGSAQLNEGMPTKKYQHQNRISEQKISQHKQQEFLNIFEDDDDEICTPSMTKLGNCLSSDDLRISFKNNQKQKSGRPIKTYKYDSPHCESIKFPVKSASQRYLHMSKNVENNQDLQQFLVIRSGKSIQAQTSNSKDTQAIKQLRVEIEQAQKQNKLIKQQNLQLRLKKIQLSSNSDTMTILSLKTQIQNMKKKISEYNEYPINQAYQTPMPSGNHRVSLGIESYDRKFMGSSQLLMDYDSPTRNGHSRCITPKLPKKIENKKMGTESFILKNYESITGRTHC